MIVLGELGIDRIDVLFGRAQLMHLSDALIVGDEFFEKDADMLGDDGVKLLNVLTCDLLIVLDDPVKMVTSDSYLVEDQLEEQLQKTEDVLSLDLLVLAILEDLFDLFDHDDEVLLVIVIDAVDQLDRAFHEAEEMLGKHHLAFVSEQEG